MYSSTAKPSHDAEAQAATASLSEATLRTSLTMLQQVVNHLPQAIAWKDKDAVFRGCNQAFAQAVGLNHPLEIVGRTASNMQWQNHPASFLHDRDHPLMEQKQAEYHRLEVLPHAEPPIWLDVSRISLCDEHGTCTGMLAVIEEATDRQQAEETLRQSEATNRALINAVPDLLFRIGRDETYLDVQSSESFKVLNPDQLTVGAKISNSLPPALAQQRMHYVQKALNTGELQIYEQELVIDDVVKYEEVRIVPCQTDEVMAMVRDITDRKQAEASLKLTQFAVDHAADTIWWVEADGSICYVNDTACRDLGYPREDILGKRVCDFAVDLPPEAWASHWHELKERGSFTFETRNQRRDGTIYPVEVTVNYIELNGKELNCALVRNITDRKRSEDALRLTQFAVDRAADPVWWVEPSGVVFYVNDAACKDLDYPREVIVGKRVFDFNPAFPPEAWAEHWQHLKQQGSFKLETLNQRKDGTIYPVEVTVNYLELNGKEFNCAFVRNITDRKQAEAALRESEHQMREQAHRERLLNRLVGRIRDSLNFDTILETTLQEVQNFTEADRCQFSWYDPNREESYWEVVKETRYAHLPSLVDRYPVSPTSPLLVQLLDLQILRVDNIDTLPESSLLRFMQRFGYKAMLAIPVRMQSGLLGTIFCCNSATAQCWSDSDIELIEAVIAQLAIALTQAELYTQSRSKAQELEQALRELQATQTQMVQSEKMSSLGQLVAGVAHEINNPVNFIYGNLNHATVYTQDLLHLIRLYQQHYPAPLHEIQTAADAIDLDFLLEDLPKLLASMKMGADRIQKIVLALRNFSRMDEAEVKQVDIHEGIDSTLMILQSRLKGKAGHTDIEVIKRYGPLPQIECYPGQLNQVFMNILSNAIDAVEESVTGDRQPSIRIQTEQADRQSIAIKISDNGCGMTQVQQQRLFDPFFTTKPVGKGTGLGLSISYQIVVEKHGGTLTCFSAQGEGTEFCIEIPMQNLV
ncbi:MAG: PAS domain S-box protein [Stenomitos rutilans HA7619-LM2]|jgi:PAS domain S-box-containing protein|nr:PAS domain S-box protein [Stenomitos rutilans HA7619-LM2]